MWGLGRAWPWLARVNFSLVGTEPEEQGEDPCGRWNFPLPEKGHILIRIPYALPDSIKMWSLISSLSKGCPWRQSWRTERSRSDAIWLLINHTRHNGFRLALPLRTLTPGTQFLCWEAAQATQRGHREVDLLKGQPSFLPPAGVNHQWTFGSLHP